MPRLSFARRGLLALVTALALSPAIAPEAAIARTPLPKSPPARCAPVQHLSPLQPLEIVTSRGRVRLQVEFADTPRTREVGLMCRRDLAPDRGMLFDFKASQDVAFWMRNTLIPLDMLFITADGRVLSIARNAQPLDETPIPAGGKVRAVLEIPGGRAAELGVLPGDRVLHRIFPRG